MDSEETSKPENEGPPPRELLVAQDALPELEKAVAKLARAAKRLGLSPSPALQVHWTRASERRKTRVVVFTGESEGPGGPPETSSSSLIAVVPATITMPDYGAVQAPGGWRLVGSLARTDEGLEPTALKPADLPTLAKYREEGRMDCDHCGAKRTRVRTMILQDGQGATKQVGCECAGAYLTDLSKALGALEFQDLLVTIVGSGDYDGPIAEYGFSGARTLRAFPVEDALAHCLVEIRRAGGFVPSKEQLSDDALARGWRPRPNPCATWRMAMEAIQYTPIELTAENRDKLTPAQKMYREQFKGRKPTAEDNQKGADLLAWIGSVQLDPAKEDLLAHLQDTTRSGFVSERRLALLAALPKAKERWEREHAPKPLVEAPTGRVVVSGKVLSTKRVTTDFGETLKWLVILDDGNKVWSSVPSGADTAPGAPVKFKATFERSEKDPHFAFGSRPTIAIEKAATKKKRLAAEVIAVHRPRDGGPDRIIFDVFASNNIHRCRAPQSIDCDLADVVDERLITEPGQELPSVGAIIKRGEDSCQYLINICDQDGKPMREDRLREEAERIRAARPAPAATPIIVGSLVDGTKLSEGFELG